MADLIDKAFDAGKRWFSHGADESGVANARVRRYGFVKWYNNQSPADLKLHRKTSLESAFYEGYKVAKSPRKNPAYRKTTRNGIPVYVSTTTGRVVKGPAGVKRSAKKLAGAVKRTVKRAVKVGVKRVKAAIKRNPKATYSGLVVAATSTSRSHLAARATALPFYSSIHKRGERYSLLVQPHNLVQAKRLIKDPPWQDVKNPKAKRKTTPRVKQSGSLVGKSKHLATMQAAQKLMPFPGAQVIQGGDQTKANTYYYLKVPSKNVAMARKILNGMAKTMTKKATK